MSGQDRYSRRTWWFVYGTWAVLTLLGLLLVRLYVHVDPVIDEWGFVPAVLGEEPFWPWLWKLHNEHRFPVPRLIWLPLTQLAGNFGAGCYLSLAIVSLSCLLMIDLARRLRGGLHYADAFFPLSMLHLGQGENLQMGYQIVFAVDLAFACVLLRIILTTHRDNLARRAIQAGIITLLLAGCGAGGLAFAPFMAVWLTGVLIAMLIRGAGIGRSLILSLLIAALPVYVWLYLQGYHPPSHHPDPVEIWGSRAEAFLQAVRSGAQALSMSFGVAAVGLWPVSAFVLGLVSFECLIHLFRTAIARVGDRPRLLGLALYLAAVLFMALGIGWGRCGFLSPDGGPGDMGLASRYSWILWPFLGAIYFQWLAFGSTRQARWIPISLFWIMVAMLPFNEVTGFIEGIKHDRFERRWKELVESGRSDDEIVEERFGGYYGSLREQIGPAVGLMRRHGFQYYRPLDAQLPVAEGHTRVLGVSIWYWLLAPAGLAVLTGALWLFRFGHEIHVERARESFRLQRERLERLFLETAARGGTPRGLTWTACRFSDEVRFAREQQSKLVVALVGVTVEFEAVAGGDMEGLPAVLMPRQGTALLHFQRGHWAASGRVIFNLSPDQTLSQMRHEFREVHSHGRHV